jgi:DNA-binding NarL/FixJ family response regulator
MDANRAGADDRPVRVLVVDDQLVFREVARHVLDATPGFELIGEADSGDAALSATAAMRPDLVLLDVRMPGMDGVEAAIRIRAADEPPVVVLVSVEEPRDVPAARTCGAAAFVRKQDFGPALLRRVWRASTSAP